jgi:hypothetical protein
MDLLSLKRNTDFLRKNNIDFFILDYTIVGRFNGDQYLNAWKAIKEKLPCNSFFLELGMESAAVILPEKSSAEAVRLLVITSKGS